MFGDFFFLSLIWGLGFKGITVYKQIRRCVMKFCQSDKISIRTAYLMILKFCELDKILIETTDRRDYMPSWSLTFNLALKGEDNTFA